MKKLLFLSFLSMNLINAQSEREITIVNKLPVDVPIVLKAIEYPSDEIERVIPNNGSLKINIPYKNYSFFIHGSLGYGTIGPSHSSIKNATKCLYSLYGQNQIVSNKNLYTVDINSYGCSEMRSPNGDYDCACSVGLF